MLRILRVALLSAFTVSAIGAAPAWAQVSLTTLGTPVTQNFDTLPASGSATWTNNSTIPGWFHARTGTGTTIVANDGSSNAGNLYSYGTGTATDRALGSLGSGNAAIGNLFWGVRLQNNTGATITSLVVSYTGEQWRNSAAAAQTLAFSYLIGSPTVTGSLAEFQSAGVAVPSLDFTGPITGGAAGALNGNLAANRTAVSFTISSLSIPNGTEVMLRWSDPDHTGADHGLSIDDVSITPNGGGPITPSLTVNDVTLAEGNAGTTTFTFTVSLSAPAGPGGVTFDIATADGTAQDDNPATEDNDYVPQSLTGQTIPAGSSTYAFNVQVNGDTATEPNETFFVNVTNVTGATVGDGQGLGTINNEDVSLTPIHDIQGPGASSPIVGASVTTRGIVTGVKSNGFFIQEPSATVDADPATSEGLFIFTSSAPPAAATVGNSVQVTGTVTEFVPAADLLQPPLTQLTSPAVTQLSTGNPLPAAIPLTATFPDPAGPFDQLERVEGMRVSVASLTVSGPTLRASINESTAISVSSGVFYGVVTGVPRPFREAGIQAPDPAPSGSIPPIPRFDSNPERIRVDSDGLVGGGLLDVGTGAVVTGLIGPLDYTFRTYTVLPDPGATLGVTGGPTPTAVTPQTGSEFTVASFNMERFFDTVNDPGIGEPVLTATAFDNRLNKASNAIRNFLRFPDILGAVEMENLTTLQALASRISSDAIAASQPDPQYTAHLVEGNDVGGIDVGFLVKTAPVAPGVPRVSVGAVVQEKAGELFVNADSSTELLNDRPTLRLNAVVNHPGGATFPVTVLVNHLRSLNGVNSIGAGSNGWATAGDRVRAKRQKQAESLADIVQTRQTANPAERIILVGDFNAFHVNDGLGDSMNVIAGTPPPDNQTAVPGDGVDLVNPDLVSLHDTPPPAERYSYIFDGNAQTLDHVLVNAALVAATTARREEHPRIDTDYPDTARNNPATALRLSDHDPVVSYYQVAGFATADLSVTKTDSPDPVTAGSNLTYTITVANVGPDPAATVSLSDTLPAGTTFVSLPAVAGWSCTTPAVGAGGTVTCTNPSFAVGSSVFTLTVQVAAGTASGTVLSNTATVSSATADPTGGNNSATATTTVSVSADVSVTKVDTPDPVTAGSNLTYTITLANAGPSTAATAGFSDTLPAGTTFVSLSSPAGWSCTTPAVGAGGTVTCSNPSFAAGGNAVFTLTVAVSPSVAAGTVLSNTATATAGTTDPDPANNNATATTTVAASADLSVTKVDTPDPVVAGNNLTYTITVASAGPSNAATVALSDTLPVGTTFVSLSSPAGWSCTTPAVGAGGTVSCTIASLAAGSGAFTLTVAVDSSLAAGTVLSNTAAVTSATTDPDPANNSATVTTTVAAAAGLSVGLTDTPDPVNAGSNLTYSITLTNAGPSNAATVALSDILPAGTTFVSLVAPGGWSCTTPAVGAGGTVTCTNPSLGVGSAGITLVVNVGSSTAPGTTITNSVQVTSAAQTVNASTTTLVQAAPFVAISATKTVSGQFTPGGAVTYTITLQNTGTAAQSDNPGDELTDVLPADLTLVSASATSGSAVATVATNTVTWNGSIPAGGTVTITIQATVDSGIAVGTVITNQATVSYDADANGTNESSTTTDNPATPGQTGDGTPFTVTLQQSVIEIPTLDTVGLALLVLLLAVGGAVLLRRRSVLR